MTLQETPSSNQIESSEDALLKSQSGEPKNPEAKKRPYNRRAALAHRPAKDRDKSYVEACIRASKLAPEEKPLRLYVANGLRLVYRTLDDQGMPTDVELELSARVLASFVRLVYDKNVVQHEIPSNQGVSLCTTTVSQTNLQNLVYEVDTDQRRVNDAARTYALMDRDFIDSLSNKLKDFQMGDMHVKEFLGCVVDRYRSHLTIYHDFIWKDLDHLSDEEMAGVRNASKEEADAALQTFLDNSLQEYPPGDQLNYAQGYLHDWAVWFRGNVLHCKNGKCGRCLECRKRQERWLLKLEELGFYEPKPLPLLYKNQRYWPRPTLEGRINDWLKTSEIPFLHIIGPAGTGKSVEAEQLFERLTRDGKSVAFYRCIAGGAATMELNSVVKSLFRGLFERSPEFREALYRKYPNGLDRLALPPAAADSNSAPSTNATDDFEPLLVESEPLKSVDNLLTTLLKAMSANEPSILIWDSFDESVLFDGPKSGEIWESLLPNIGQQFPNCRIVLLTRPLNSNPKFNLHHLSLTGPSFATIRLTEDKSLDGAVSSVQDLKIGILEELQVLFPTEQQSNPTHLKALADALTAKVIQSIGNYRYASTWFSGLAYRLPPFPSTLQTNVTMSNTASSQSATQSSSRRSSPASSQLQLRLPTLQEIQDLPPSLDGLYFEELQRYFRHKPPTYAEVQRLLQFAIASPRNLSYGQLKVLMGNTDIDTILLYLRTFYTKTSAPLDPVTPNTEFAFTHYSCREFFEQSSQSYNYHIEPKEAHRVMAQRLLALSSQGAKEDFQRVRELFNRDIIWHLLRAGQYARAIERLRFWSNNSTRRSRDGISLRQMTEWTRLLIEEMEDKGAEAWQGINAQGLAELLIRHDSYQVESYTAFFEVMYLHCHGQWTEIVDTLTKQENYVIRTAIGEAMAATVSDDGESEEESENEKPQALIDLRKFANSKTLALQEVGMQGLALLYQKRPDLVPAVTTKKTDKPETSKEPDEFKEFVQFVRGMFENKVFTFPCIAIEMMLGLAYSQADKQNYPHLEKQLDELQKRLGEWSSPHEYVRHLKDTFEAVDWRVTHPGVTLRLEEQLEISPDLPSLQEALDGAKRLAKKCDATRFPITKWVLNHYLDLDNHREEVVKAVLEHKVSSNKPGTGHNDNAGDTDSGNDLELGELLCVLWQSPAWRVVEATSVAAARLMRNSTQQEIDSALRYYHILHRKLPHNYHQDMGYVEFLFQMVQNDGKAMGFFKLMGDSEYVEHPNSCVKALLFEDFFSLLEDLDNEDIEEALDKYKDQIELALRSRDIWTLNHVYAFRGKLAQRNLSHLDIIEWSPKGSLLEPLGDWAKKERDIFLSALHDGLIADGVVN